MPTHLRRKPSGPATTRNCFLGRLLGYFGGPAAELIDQDERKGRLEKGLLDRLDVSARPLFEDARNGVLSKYIEMTDESADARERAASSQPLRPRRKKRSPSCKSTKKKWMLASRNWKIAKARRTASFERSSTKLPSRSNR